MRYPLFLNLQDQPVVVIGAGQVATRKIRSLRAAGAVVTVISPKAIPFVARASSPFTSRRQTSRHTGKMPVLRLRWLRRVYRPGDLRGAVLVVAATDDSAVNRRVCAEAKRRRQLVNCITEPAAGNFIVPAVARRGGITLAISTGGRSPSLAKKLRQEVERWLSRRSGALHD